MVLFHYVGVLTRTLAPFDQEKGCPSRSSRAAAHWRLETSLAVYKNSSCFLKKGPPSLWETASVQAVGLGAGLAAGKSTEMFL